MENIAKSLFPIFINNLNESATNTPEIKQESIRYQPRDALKKWEETNGSFPNFLQEMVPGQGRRKSNLMYFFNLDAFAAPSLHVMEHPGDFQDRF